MEFHSLIASTCKICSSVRHYNGLEIKPNGQINCLVNFQKEKYTGGQKNFFSGEEKPLHNSLPDQEHSPGGRQGPHIKCVGITTPFTRFGCKYPQIKAECLHLKHS